nr:PREDICTED: succinate receptor 1-like [Latimeria chalumnae]XP_014344115.1 PREDICTED: succinate receptor 1-like [Latimeria chalumnae]|eukprot:XP_005996516.1 PREDICTED: succinate receptor 1-like [Latimeria chalumnae]
MLFKLSSLQLTFTNQSEDQGNNSLMGPEEACTTLDVILHDYYVPAVYGILCIIGFLSNVSVLIVYIFGMREWNRSNIFLFNLLLADLIYICTLPFLVSCYTNHGMWYYGEFMCRFTRYCFHANLYTSILFLGCVSMDRYLLVAHPVKSIQLFKKWHAVAISLLIWVIVTLELIPIFYLVTIESTNSTSIKCLDYASSGDVLTTFIFSMTLTVTGFFLPYGIIVFSYVLVVQVLKKLQERKQNSEKVEKPLNLIIFALVLFSVSFLPYHIMRNARIASRMFFKSSSCPIRIIKAVYALVRPISSFNSCLNPIFYFLAGGTFRKKLISLFRLKQWYRRDESVVAVTSDTVQDNLRL